MNSNRASFTAADTMPVKLLQNKKLIESIVENKTIPPLHVQFIPTNRCNLKCSFCSCNNDDRSTEMSKADAVDMAVKLKNLGTEGITITGGGEPLLWPHLDDFLQICENIGIKTGLVTNGVLLSRQKSINWDRLTWCRISQGDAREKWSDKFLTHLSYTIQRYEKVDWAFSYVVSDKPDLNKIKNLLNFADDHDFTHVRLVADLLCTDKVPMQKLSTDLVEIKSKLNVPIIFQDRKQPELGENCRVCYLRPVVTPDLKVYACCGAQYALVEPTLNFPRELCLGSVSELPGIIAKSSEPFEGAKYCEYCYYGNYNRTLDLLMTETVHKEFI